MPVSYFFDDMPSPDQITAESPAESMSETDEFESMARRETLEFVRAYYRIEDPGVRKRTFDLLKALGGDRIALLEE